MKYGLQEIDWSYIGAMLARADHDKQVKFFREFTRECKSWGTNLQVEQQLAAVNLRLTPKEREVLAMLSYEEK